MNVTQQSSSASILGIEDEEEQLLLNDKETSSSSIVSEVELLGVSVHWLCTGVVDEIHKAGLDEQTSCIHDLECLRGPPGIARRRSSLIKSPVDGRVGAAYVHCLSHEDHVGRATHILSYTWSYTWSSIVQCLNDFCSNHNLDPKRTYIWIDLLCINQHRVVEAKEGGGTGLMNFDKEFPQLLSQIGHMLVMMSPWNQPLYLKRIWCIFEMYTAHVLPYCYVTIIIPSKEKVALENDLFVDQGGMDALYEALGSTKVQNADASFEKDRQFILGMIENGVGCTTLNNVVNEFLRSWVRTVLNEIIEDRLLVDRPRGSSKEEDSSSSPSPSLRTAILMYKIGIFLHHNDEYDEALQWMNKSLSLYNDMGGDGHEEEIAKCYISIGDILRDKGDYEASLIKYQTAESISSMGGGTRATCYHSISKTLFCRADYDSALIHCRKALKIREDTYGVNDPSTAESYSFIGTILGHKGDYDAALEGHRKAAEIYQNVYGTDHPKIANCYNDIGNEMAQRRDHDGALVEYTKALTIREAVLGVEHALTGDSYNNIGNMLAQKSDIDGALASYRKSLKIREAVFGDNHPKTARSYNNIANLLANKGEFDQAMEMYHKAHSIRSETLGTKHPEVSNSHFNLGRLMSRKGDYDDALVEFRTALAIHKSIFGENHPKIADIYIMISNVLSKKGDHNGALVECRKAYLIYESMKHPKKGSAVKLITKLKRRIEETEENK